MFLLAFPAIQGVSLLLIGRQVLGETPALALISLGVWLWLKSWARGNARMAAACGLCIGFGLVSKTQVVFGLLPALIAIGLLRSRARRGWLVANLPWIVVLLVLSGWAVWSGLNSPADIRLRNAQMLSDAVHTQLLTGQWGRALDRPALAISLLMLLAASAETVRLSRRRRGPGFPTDADWGSGLLVLFVVFSCIWFALFSIGWPRYTTVGFIYALLLLGRFVWNTAHTLASHFITGWARRARHAQMAGIALLGLLAMPLTLGPIHEFQPTSDAQAAADFVSANIPREAVVESWTWELDALSDHWRFHHPDLSYLYLAERQGVQSDVAFSLGYDTLQADPDYLISGPFSQWVSLYDPEVIRTSFRPRGRLRAVHHLRAHRLTNPPGASDQDRNIRGSRPPSETPELPKECIREQTSPPPLRPVPGLVRIRPGVAGSGCAGCIRAGRRLVAPCPPVGRDNQFLVSGYSRGPEREGARGLV